MRSPRLSARLRRRVLARVLESNRRLEARYERALGRVVGQLHTSMNAALEPKLPLFAAKSDAGHSVVGTTIDNVLLGWATNLPRTVGPAFNQHAASVSKANAQALRLIGVKPSDLRIESDIVQARNANLAYVEKAGRAYAEDVRQIFEDPATFGQSVDDIKQRLQERASVSSSRAELIARDQTLKLNGAITQTRQENAGITRYTWSTSLDERVRPEHAALEGQEFEWTSPPAVGHPGEDFQCRCVAIPVLDDIAPDETAPAPDTASMPDEPGPSPEENAPEEDLTELTPGVHAKIIDFDDVARNKALKARAENVVASLDDAPTLRFLEKNPLRKISLEKNVYDGREPINGQYAYYGEGRTVVRVSLERLRSTFGDPWEPGGTWSMSGAEKTAEAAAKTTFRHELGHHIALFEGRDSAVDKMVVEAFERAKKDGIAITHYAATDPDEYFAESYTAYYRRREDLAAHDPNGLKLVEDVLRLRGILPP